MKKCIPRPFFKLTMLTLFALLLVLPLTFTISHAQLSPGQLVVVDQLGGGKFIGAIYAVDVATGDRVILSSFDNTEQGIRLFTGKNAEISPTGDVYLMSGRRLVRVDAFTGFRTTLSNLDDALQGIGENISFPDTLTPAATTGNSVPFEATSDIFLDSDLGTRIISGTAEAVIVAVPSASIVLADIISPFPNTEPIQPGLWFIRGVLRGIFGGVATADDGTIYATVPEDQVLLRIDPDTGIRTIISDLNDLDFGPFLQRANRVIMEPSGLTLLLLDIGFDKIVRFDIETGFRTLLSDFKNVLQGVKGINVSDFVLEPSGDILVTETFNRLLVRVNRVNGFRTLVSNFDDPSQGPVGRLLEGVAVNEEGVIFVVDSQAGGELLVNGAVFEVDPDTGKRRIVSNFGDNTEGPKGFKPVAIAVATPVSPTPEQELLVDSVLLASEDVTINKSALVSSGNVITNNDMLEAKVTVNKKARTAQGFKVWANAIVIGKNAVVGGDVLWDQRISNKGQILGEETRSADFPIFPGLMPLHRALTGDADIVIRKKGTLSLPPGRFKSIDVQKGAFLFLEGGVYEVETFTAGKGAVVIYEGPVELRASKGASFGKNSFFRGPNGSALDAKSALFYSEKGFDAGKRSSIQANIIAPLGTVQLGKLARFTGFIYARNIVLGKGAIVAHNNFLEASVAPAP